MSLGADIKAQIPRRGQRLTGPVDSDLRAHSPELANKSHRPSRLCVTEELIFGQARIV